MRTTARRFLFYASLFWSRTIGYNFKFDMYGVMLFGVRFTPLAIAEKLGGFTEEQLKDFKVSQVLFGKYWMVRRKAV